MYIRWKEKPRTKLTYKGHEVHATLYTAYLVECKRVEGKPRQTTIYLASIQDKQVPHVSRCADFWQHALSKLQGISLPSEQRTRIEEALAKRVPRPTDKQIKEAQASFEAFKRYLASKSRRL